MLGDLNSLYLCKAERQPRQFLNQSETNCRGEARDYRLA
jgi:hypothetical protein